MKKVSIISRVDVCYDEADIIRLITAEIETDNPSVQVNSVSLERKINPPRVSVVVDASVRGTMKGTGIDSPVSVEDIANESDFEEATLPEKEDEAATVADIFAEDGDI